MSPFMNTIILFTQFPLTTSKTNRKLTTYLKHKIFLANHTKEQDLCIQKYMAHYGAYLHDKFISIAVLPSRHTHDQLLETSYFSKLCTLGQKPIPKESFCISHLFLNCILSEDNTLST